MNCSSTLCNQKVATSALREAMRKAMAGSVAAEFWELASTSLNEFDGLAEINLDQLTTLMLGWLDSAVTGQWDVGTQSTEASARVEGLKNPASKSVARQASTLDSARGALDPNDLSIKASVDDNPGASLNLAPAGPAPGIRWHAEVDGRGKQVFLNIYDAFHDKKIGWINSILAPENSNWRLGGAFHAGVEVNGMEWSYGFIGWGDWCGLESPARSSSAQISASCASRIHTIVTGFDHGCPH